MNARILVVEDEPIVQLDLQHRLERMGHTVIGTATTGEEAVAKAIDLKPDLVLMDVSLEGSIDGIEAARRIHAEQDTPVVYVTAYAATFDEATPRELGGSFLSKPYRTTELKSAIARILESSASVGASARE
ncbi:MAG: response regulator [Bryobacteraceae bacterium]